MDRWLLTKGVCRLEADFTFDKDEFSTFKVNQFFEVNADEKYKVHCIDIGLYYSPKEVVYKEVLIKDEASTDLTSVFKGLKRP